jgi:hypothetical protein
MGAYECVGVRACVCVCACASAGCVGAGAARRGPAVLIARPRVRGCGSVRSAGFAAGVTWTSRTLKAEWAARAYHTSVVDAAGAIYVIGGYGGTGILYNDVWVSTDGGA